MICIIKYTKTYAIPETFCHKVHLEVRLFLSDILKNKKF